MAKHAHKSAVVHYKLLKTTVIPPTIPPTINTVIHYKSMNTTAIPPTIMIDY